MADVLDFPWTSPDETSDDGPALAIVGDRRYMAWVGSGNDHLNIMPSSRPRRRIVGFDSNAKVVVEVAETQEVQSLGGPALTGTSDGLLLLAWTHNGGGLLGGGGATSMFGIYFDQAFQRRGFVASLDTSDDGPALTNWSAGNGTTLPGEGRGTPI